MQQYLVSETNVELYISNIRAAYYQALQYPSLVEEGLNWYAIAHEKAYAMAHRLNDASIFEVCGVIAALSPNNRWERNLVDAETLFRHAINGGKLDNIRVSTYAQNKEKAWLICRGVADPLDVIRGNKTKSFYQCLIAPDKSDAVCVDSHAVNIALGRQASIARTPALTDNKYALIAFCYTTATREINEDSVCGSVLPLQVQALTWTYYRVMRGLDARFSIQS